MEKYTRTVCFKHVATRHTASVIKKQQQKNNKSIVWAKLKNC